MDCLHLTGIRAYGYTGVLPEEQTLGQWFEVDLIVWLDLSKAGKSDVLTDTYDYRETIAAVQQILATARFQLIERLAEEIAQVVLSNPKTNQVQVKLTKLTPPIPNFSGSITVELTRSSD